MSEHTDVVARLSSLAARLLPMLARSTYYEILGVQRKVDLPALRVAFFRWSAELHPDRLPRALDGGLRDRLETIYARMTEAYRALSVPELRTAYDAGLKAGRFRLESSPRAEVASKNPEDELRSPEAKKFFRLGMVAFATGDYKGAAMNFGFAKAIEPASALIAKRLGEAQSRERAATRRK